MAKFRKRPVVIEAHKFTFLDADKNNKPEFEGPPPEWLREGQRKAQNEEGAIFVGINAGSKPALLIHTLEGDHACTNGDWIIKGVKGELYPCKPDIFEATYEEIE